jgi:hypothetical protein
MATNTELHGIFMYVPTRNTLQKTTGSGRYLLSEERGTSLLWPVILISIAALVIAVSPVSAGEQYMSGSPELSAYLGGTNEFSPGQEVQIAVVVENSGLNQFKFVKTGIVDREDLPNTAKFLTVTLEAGDSPFIIKTDPQMLGDLKASSTATGKFTVRIPSDTPAGVYTIPVKLNYTYLQTAEQYGVDTVQNFYKTKDEVFEFSLRVKPDVRISVVSSEFRELNAGTEGSITLNVKNTGHEDGRKAILTLVRNDGSPVVPTEGSAYIGDFPAGSTATAVFKASVSDSAEAQTYPLDVYVKYENSDGDSISSDIETIGVPVGKKTEFVIVSEPVTLIPGQKKTINVSYRNTGGATAHQAQARVSMVDPFTSNDDTAYLGDVAPGETKAASFLVSVDRAATLKTYGIDSEIRYRDAFDNQIISDPIKLGLTVSEDTGFVAGLMKNPLLLAVIAVIILGAGYVVYRKRANP